MPWSAVRVRPATVADLPALLGFADELRDQPLPALDGKRGRALPPTARDTLESHFRDALADPDRHLVVAVGDDDAALGMALFSVGPTNPLLDLPALHVSHVVVGDGNRRRGAGKALVAAAAAFADEQGLDQVVVSINPGSREANRFFARLGFAPVVVRRVASVSLIRRRLGIAAPRPVDHVVRLRPRRAGRLRRATLPLGPAGPES
jgi:GNAT superfamily N-acetyltransferase